MTAIKMLSGAALLLAIAACGETPAQVSTTTDTAATAPAERPDRRDPDVMPPNEVNTDRIGSAELLAPDDGSPFLMIEPNRLPGMSAAEIVRELGTPDFVSKDTGVQTMLYEAPGCVLDISLREASANAPFRVDYVTARNRRGTLIPIHNCLEQLAER